MYLDHFGLREPPFRITPHTEFFFAGANRGATLDALIYAITHDEGIVKVSGEVGSGKTMLCRVLLERLPPHVVTIYLANPSLTRDDILYAIADELHLTLPAAARSAYIVRALQNHLIGLYGEGRQVVVLIDEAHAMPAETLEEIRLLSNLESNRHKLLQLVMFGQPELNDILARSNMRQLKERITHNFTLGPLAREDISDYINFRLRAAGYKGASVFSPGAAGLLARASHGLTRRINILADKALLASYAANKHEVGPEEVKAAIKDCEFSTSMPTWKSSAPAVAGALVLAVVGLLAYTVLDQRGAPAEAQAQGVAAAPPPAPAQAGETTSVPAATPTAAPAAVAPAAPPAAAQAAAAAPAPALPPGVNVGKRTAERLAAGQQWLKEVDDRHWFLQMQAVDTANALQLEPFLEKIAPLVAVDQTRVYLGKRGNTPRIGVIYGDFPSQEAAVKFAGTLPAELRNYKPYPRPVQRLR